MKTYPALANILVSKSKSIDNILSEVEDMLRQNPIWQDETAENEIGDVLSCLTIASNQLEKLAERLADARLLVDGTWQSQAERDQLNQIAYQRMAE